MIIHFVQTNILIEHEIMYLHDSRHLEEKMYTRDQIVFFLLSYLFCLKHVAYNDHNNNITERLVCT